MSRLATPAFVMGGVFLVLASLFSVKKHQLIHDFFVVVSVFLVAVGVILVSLALFQLNYLYGYFLIGLTFMAALSLVFSDRFEGGTWEIPLFLSVFLWNVVATAFLLTC